MVEAVFAQSDLFHRLQGSSFCGVPASQTWVDFYMWEALLNGMPHLRGIVEIGTWEGGFSRYLHAQAEGREMFFRTYDVVVPNNPPPGFCRLDVFANQEELGAWLRSKDPVALLCDGGNKPRELQTFSRYLSSESVIVVHDWGTEMQIKHVPDNVEFLHLQWFAEIGSMSRAFKVRQDHAA